MNSTTTASWHSKSYTVQALLKLIVLHNHTVTDIDDEDKIFSITSQTRVSTYLNRCFIISPMKQTVHPYQKFVI